MFPQARIIRADGQTMKGLGSQAKLYKDFSQKKSDILVGTQMISKGWDLPSVALVGIIDADNLLSFLIFNASERLIKALSRLPEESGGLAQNSKAV